MRVLRIVQSFALVAAIPVLAMPAHAATSCQAEVRATPRSDQVTDEAVTKVFAVEVDTKEACAKVYVDFVVTERLFDGEVITSTIRGFRKVANHTSTYKLNYRIARDSTLNKWEFKVHSCDVCGTE